MTQQLVSSISWMCLWLMVGLMNFISAGLTTNTWGSIFYIVLTFLYFFGAWINYRRAKRTAEALDFVRESLHKQAGLHLQLFKIIFPDKKAEPEAELDENENFGHPV